MPTRTRLSTGIRGGRPVRHRRDREERYRTFQLKVGGDREADVERIRAASALMRPGDVLIADANTGWLPHEAQRVVRAVRYLDVYIEQPCLTYEECLSVRRRTDHPFVLDESVDGIGMLIRGPGRAGTGDRAADGGIGGTGRRGELSI